MGQGKIAILLNDGNINIVNKLDGVTPNELSQLIVNLEILREDLLLLFKKTVKKQWKN